MCQEYIACFRHVGQTEDFDRHGRTGFFDTASLVVYHRADLTARRTCGNEIADMQRTLLNQHACHRAASLIQLSLQHNASRHTVRICL